MGYNKVITYGDYLEHYEYEKNIEFNGRRSKGKRYPLLGSEDNDDGKQDRSKTRRQDNAKRTSMAFRRLVLANISEQTMPVLLTLTYKINNKDLYLGYQHFKSFARLVKSRVSPLCKYIAVVEFQKRGAVHFHALFWGIPEVLCQSERSTRFLQGLWGRGFIDIDPIRDRDRVSTYLAKYMVKAFLDPRLSGRKAYVSSRNVSRPYSFGGSFDFYPYLVDYGAVDNSLLEQFEYDTIWLGKGRVKKYLIK